MLRSILIALDGSAHSRAATEFGARCASEFDAELVGVGVVNEPAIHAPEAVPIGASYFKADRDEALLAEARSTVDSILRNFAQKCASLDVRYRTVRYEVSPCEALLEEAQRHDVVVLGQQTNFRSEEGENVSDALPTLLRQSARPIVAVPKNLPDGNSIVVAYDGRTPAARSLQAFQSLEMAADHPVHVLTIAGQREDAERSAHLAVEFLRVHDVQANPVPIATTKPPGETILDQLQPLNARLLVMGAHGKSTWAEYFRGSITRQMLDASPVPVFLCN